MAATIRFCEGTEATLIDEKGTWVCADPQLAECLRLSAEFHLMEKTYFLSPINELARDVAREVGADVVHTDPESEGVPGDLAGPPPKRQEVK